MIYSVFQPAFSEGRLFLVKRKLLINEGIAKTFVNPPDSPKDRLFSKMSVNLFGRLEEPGGTVRVRRNAGLAAMCMRDE